jgi:adenylate kinase family enzyme
VSETGRQALAVLGAARRILVVGPCGAGKSTFAKQLASLRGLPLWHMDRVHWRPGWVPLEKAALAEEVQAIVEGEAWVIDGTYASSLMERLSHTQLVVHLDYPRSVYMPRLFKRLVQNAGRTRPDMAPGCPERVTFDFLRYAWRFSDTQRPQLVRAISYSRVMELRLDRPAGAARVLSGLRTSLAQPLV